MNNEDYLVSRFDGAVLLLPYALRESVRKLDRTRRASAEELRLRVGRPPAVLLPEGETELGKRPVTARDLDMLLELATGASAHAAGPQLRRGFVTARGGYRVGLCGPVIMRGGEMEGYSALSSAAVRISREIKGAAAPLMPRIVRAGELMSAVILSPPGWGKTTLLRDVIRAVSDGEGLPTPLRVGLADERGEIAAVSGGEPQMDVGSRTDVLTGCPKAEGVEVLMRSMNPEVVALDEITSPEDIEAVTRAANCGVKLLATAHASCVEDMARRPLYRRILDCGAFDMAVVIRKTGALRRYEAVSVR